ncbi:MAG TPA: cyclic nucleotide-binding domain-containing protein [Syntrophales bacterium]|nr:cyclic nucleotide-binding domain-containing protein [Syntrophales bacterium]HOL59558.1 cyclic nucleotide-binding domain-containing protein [Syntrophales bacterium]HPO35648.1 cyclic nucleotide-binding domain-containing protein [Syntrophales bacterium]
MKIPLFPEHSRIKIGWDLLMVISIFASSLVISYRLVSRQAQVDGLYWLITFLFFVDILVNFNTEVRKGLTTHADRMAVAKHYLSRWFVVDLLAFVPWAPIYVVLSGGDAVSSFYYQVFLSLRLLKLMKMPVIFKSLKELVNVPPALVRLIIFFLWFVLVAHFMALGWIAMGAGEADRSFGDQYLRALYWCITTIATIGYGDYIPNRDSNTQIVYTIVVQIIGVGMFGYIVGNVATLVVNIDAARARFYARLEEVRNYMRIKRIPPSLQNRIKNYYRYLWETRHGISDAEFLSLLPKTIRTEVALFLNRDILEKVSVFKEADEVFIREVIEELEPMVFLPGDFIIRQGEHGDSMYFLNTGSVEVIVDERTVAVLAEGSAFGEMALIKNVKRNASVRALSYCDVYKLSKNSFDHLRRKYPEFDRQVSEISSAREKALEKEI